MIYIIFLCIRYILAILAIYFDFLNSLSSKFNEIYENREETGKSKEPSQL